MNFKGIIIVVFSTVLFSACGRNELKLPAQVFLNFSMDSFESEDDDENENKTCLFEKKGGGSKIEIDKGILVIDAIEFDGRRQQGNDVFFISDFSSPIIADLETGETNIDVSFDIPQGIYYRIDLLFNFGTSDQIPLVLEGKFKSGNSDAMSVRFEYNFVETITVRGKPKSGQNDIVLRKDEISEVSVSIDLESLFRFVNPSEFNGAEMIQENGEIVLLVNQTTNLMIFNKLANRLSNSIEVAFE